MNKNDAIRELYSTVVNIVGNPDDTPVCTDENGNEVTIDLDAVNTLVASKQYQEDRQYPSIGEQLDMQYWDAVNGTTTWKDAIAQVKADNPKPE